MIPEHLTRYSHARFDVIDLLDDIRKYSDSVGMERWTLEQYQHEMKRIFNTANAAVERLGGKVLPRKEYR